jgi:hypothetical protein
MARHTFAEEMTCTLENLPRREISGAMWRKTPLPQSTE